MLRAVRYNSHADFISIDNTKAGAKTSQAPVTSLHKKRTQKQQNLKRKMLRLSVSC